MANEPTNAMLETRDPIAALRWNALLEMQVAAYLPYELSFYFGWQAWGSKKRVLDAGCGNGFFLSGLRRFFPDKDYAGLDISAELIDAAKVNNNLEGVELTQSDFFAYQPVAQFDVVILRLIVQHMSGIEQIFDKLRQLVRLGGSALIIEPEPRLFFNYPRTPVFEKLLSSYAVCAEKNRLNRASIANLPEQLKDLVDWTIRQDKTYVAPSVGPFDSSAILQIYTLWIDLFRQAPGLDYPFDEAQKELAVWAKSDQTFTQVGIRIIELTRNK